MIRIFSLLILIVLIYNCKPKSTSETYQPPLPSNLTGKELAQTYCGSCHLYPEPSLLDSLTWAQGVLPKMLARLGLEQDSFKLFASLDFEEIHTIANSGIYPDHPQIANEDWAKIVKFYLENSPKIPSPQDEKPTIKNHLTGFRIKQLTADKNKIPSVTLVKFDSPNKKIIIGYRGSSNFLKKYDLDFNQTDSIPLPSPIADIYHSKLLCMGQMDPNDKKKGGLLIENSKKSLIDSLQRPVNMAWGDLNGDKIEDYVICQFGNELGKVSWFDGKTNKENKLNELPGARNASIKDINNDGLLDITVLMTQAKEQILTYINIGSISNPRFEEKSILKFPPVYGSSYFELVDFNQDGYQDILYTNGDNADLSIVLKKYHGIRIFLNDGKGYFTQTYFYPMHGASKAMAADFDLDGDLDIAAISFFTDPKQVPNEGFLLLSNEGDNTSFSVSTFEAAKTGKWLVMDIADMDSDGDNDIILGSFKLKMTREINPTLKRQIEVIILENKKISSN
ncbi:MAG: VCBS repeat-containing protein [Bacteroidota bacterium]